MTERSPWNIALAVVVGILVLTLFTVIYILSVGGASDEEKCASVGGVMVAGECVGWDR